MKKNLQYGFTLVEVMVAVSILSFLSSIAFYAFGTARANAQDAVTLATAVATKDAIHQYVEDNGASPVSTANVVISENQNGGADWNGVMQKLVNGGLLNRVPHSGNPNKPMWIARFQNPEGQQLTVLGFSYKNNSGGGVVTDQCDPLTNQGGGNTNTGPGDGGNSVSQNQIDKTSQLAQVEEAVESGSNVTPESGGQQSASTPGQGSLDPTGAENGNTADGGDTSGTGCPAGQVRFGNFCINLESLNNGGNNTSNNTAGQSQNTTPPVNEQQIQDGGTTDPCSQFVGTCTCL